jgi:hypothetical protein
MNCKVQRGAVSGIFSGGDPCSSRGNRGRALFPAAPVWFLLGSRASATVRGISTSPNLFGGPEPPTISSQLRQGCFSGNIVTRAGKKGSCQLAVLNFRLSLCGGISPATPCVLCGETDCRPRIEVRGNIATTAMTYEHPRASAFIRGKTTVVCRRQSVVREAGGRKKEANREIGVPGGGGCQCRDTAGDSWPAVSH